MNHPGIGSAQRARWTAVVLVALALACPAAAAAANDRFVDAAPLGYGIPATASNVGATIEPNGESMTLNGFAPNYNACYFTTPPHANDKTPGIKSSFDSIALHPYSIDT